MTESCSKPPFAPKHSLLLKPALDSNPSAAESTPTATRDDDVATKEDDDEEEEEEEEVPTVRAGCSASAAAAVLSKLPLLFDNDRAFAAANHLFIT